MLSIELECKHSTEVYRLGTHLSATCIFDTRIYLVAFSREKSVGFLKYQMENYSWLQYFTCNVIKRCEIKDAIRFACGEIKDVKYIWTYEAALCSLVKIYSSLVIMELNSIYATNEFIVQELNLYLHNLN